MTKIYEPSVSLHQQDGGITVQAFAEQHGMVLSQMRYHVKKGRVVGARQDSRSKKWMIYPPARLVDGSYRQQRKTAAGVDVGVGLPPARRGVDSMASSSNCVAASDSLTVTQSSHNATRSAQGAILAHNSTTNLVTDGVDVGTSPHGLPADGLLPVQETCETSNLTPPAKRSFNAFEQRAEVASIVVNDDTGQRDVYTSAEVKNIRRVLQEARAQAHRKGIHYLHLDSREFSQLYAALAHERSRIRKLLGKGLVDVGNLRASDSVWQKLLQAICHEGRLL